VEEDLTENLFFLLLDISDTVYVVSYLKMLYLDPFSY